MNINTFKAIYPNTSFITEPESYFEGVKNEYIELKENGFFNKDGEELLYIYRIQTADRSFLGLVAAVSVHDFINGHIKGHEETLLAKEQVHVNIVLRNRAFLKPVLLTYPHIHQISKVLETYISTHDALISIEEDIHGQTHTFWQITESKINEQLIEMFNKQVNVAYIADGHHRSSTTALLYNRLVGKPEQQDFSTLLAAFFPSDQLIIEEFNRVVEIPDHITDIAFMARLSKVCDITPLKTPHKPRKKHEMTMYLKREWFVLKWRNRIIKKYLSEGLVLDVNLLNIEILQKILEVEDIKNDPDVRYIDGSAGINAVRIAASKKDGAIGFCLYPVELDELMLVSDKGMLLPPKSTFFKPRLRNGLIIMDH